MVGLKNPDKFKVSFCFVLFCFVLFCFVSVFLPFSFYFRASLLSLLFVTLLTVIGNCNSQQTNKQTTFSLHFLIYIISRGKKAFGGYLGADESTWNQVKTSSPSPSLQNPPLTFLLPSSPLSSPPLSPLSSLSSLLSPLPSPLSPLSSPLSPLPSTFSTLFQYDSTEVAKTAEGGFKILIDQGAGDKFYPDHLLPGNFVKACEGTNHSVELRVHEVICFCFCFCFVFVLFILFVFFFLVLFFHLIFFYFFLFCFSFS